MKAPACNLQDLEDLLVPDFTGHLQRFCGDRSGLFWWHEEDLHNFRQVVVILWLIGGYIFALLSCIKGTPLL